MNAIEKALWFIESHFASIRCSDGPLDHALRAWAAFDRSSEGPIGGRTGYFVRCPGCGVWLT